MTKEKTKKHKIRKAIGYKTEDNTFFDTLEKAQKHQKEEDNYEAITDWVTRHFRGYSSEIHSVIVLKIHVNGDELKSLL